MEKESKKHSYFILQDTFKDSSSLFGVYFMALPPLWSFNGKENPATNFLLYYQIQNWTHIKQKAYLALTPLFSG